MHCRVFSDVLENRTATSAAHAKHFRLERAGTSVTSTLISSRDRRKKKGSATNYYT